VRRMRALLAEHGLVLTPLQRRTRERRGGYKGRHFAAKLLQATRYVPSEPCPVHPEAYFRTSRKKCVDCEEELRQIYDEYKHDPQELAFQQASWPL
jgi:hypothetical protein